MPLVKEMCDGCIKSLKEDNECIAYAYPENWYRLGGCPLKSNKVLEIKNVKKINPLKASRHKKRSL